MEIIDHKSGFEEAREFATTLAHENVGAHLNLHNWDYIESKLGIADDLMKKMDLSEDEIYIVRFSVMFVYLGYQRDYDNPYRESIALAKENLNRANYPANFVNQVANTIQIMEGLDDGNNKQPDKLQSVLLDVHYSFIGLGKFKDFLKDWWLETNMNNKDQVGEYEWVRDMSKGLSKFEFYNDRAKKKFDSKKKKNLLKLKKYIVDLRDSSSLSNNKSAQTMFKTTMRNQVDLISIADKKAGIMISINSILMTLLLPLMASYLIDLSRYMIPAMIMVITCGATIILATLATRPGKLRGELDEDHIKQGDRSLFYFGNFHEMDRDEYEQAIRGTIARKNVLESSLINDLYDLGVSLGRKYKRLRVCYLVFALGIGLTLASIAISMLIPMGF